MQKHFETNTEIILKINEKEFKLEKAMIKSMESKTK